ncbi:MAG: hypothetical protein CMJ78_20540 [Planctomycetaceae bacterium]|nr:hypothetical protein [Planctomycetaceae bacterium]
MQTADSEVRLPCPDRPAGCWKEAASLEASRLACGFRGGLDRRSFASGVFDEVSDSEMPAITPPTATTLTAITAANRKSQTNAPSLPKLTQPRIIAVDMTFPQFLLFVFSLQKQDAPLPKVSRVS